MNQAHAEGLAARQRLAAIGWIAGRSEFFRHLPPPALAVWLGEGEDVPTAVAFDVADAGWTLHPPGDLPQGHVDAQWLDAGDAGQRARLFAGLALPGDSDADRFSWAHHAICRHGLRLRIGGKIDPKARPGETVFIELRRQTRAAVEAPTLVIDVFPGVRCVLLETHEPTARAHAVVQNLDIHITLGAGATLQHLRVATPGSQDRVAHQVRARVGRGARYEQALIASGSRYHLQRTEFNLHAAQGSARCGAALFAAGSALEQQVEVLHGGVDTSSDVEALLLASGKAHGVVNACSHIAAGADEASVRQRLSGIPTGGEPRLVLRPHLEIHHDKVQAVHGATWGALPEDALFYARQRGLDERSARALIIEGLLTAVLERTMGEPEVLQALGVGAWLNAAVASHLAVNKELVA